MTVNVCKGDTVSRYAKRGWIIGGKRRGFGIMEPANNFGLSVMFVRCFVLALANRFVGSGTLLRIKRF